jgi:hypothetical protein
MIVEIVLNRPKPKTLWVLFMDWIPQRNDVLDIGTEPPHVAPDQGVPCVQADGYQHVRYLVRQVVHRVYTSPTATQRVMLFVDVLGDNGEVIAQPGGHLPGLPVSTQNTLPDSDCPSPPPSTTDRIDYMAEASRFQEIMKSFFSPEEQAKILDDLRQKGLLSDQWVEISGLIQVCKAYCQKNCDTTTTRLFLSQLLDHEQLPIVRIKTEQGEC